MPRKLAILLGVCVAVVCAFINYLGTQSSKELNDKASDPVSISCSELLKEWPADTFHLQLHGYQRGKEIAARDYNRDQSWDVVYVPLFPATLREVGNNYSSVIVYFDDVHNEQELEAKLAEGKFESQLWFAQQELPTDIHSELAGKYRLMDFSKCVVLQGGFNRPSPALGTSAILGSYLGMLAAGIVVIWNVIAMLIPARKERDYEDELPRRTTNRAGLPDF